MNDVQLKNIPKELLSVAISRALDFSQSGSSSPGIRNGCGYYRPGDPGSKAMFVHKTHGGRIVVQMESSE